MTPTCMTADELRAWREAAAEFARLIGQGAMTPCVDCPVAFHREMRAEGCCNGRPNPLGGRPPTYSTDAERIAARRVSWAKSKRLARARARAAWDNTAAGSGRESNRMTPDLRPAATTRGPEVVASQGVVVP